MLTPAERLFLTAFEGGQSVVRRVNGADAQRWSPINRYVEITKTEKNLGGTYRPAWHVYVRNETHSIQIECQPMRRSINLGRYSALAPRARHIIQRNYYQIYYTINTRFVYNTGNVKNT